MTNLGQILLAISTFAALISIVLLVLGHISGPKQGEGLTNAGYFATFAVFGSTTASLLMLLVAMFQKNFSLLYVVENHSTDVSGLSWLFNISALWAGREGSLLFWAWLLSGFVAYMAWKRISVTDALSNIAIAILNFVQIFFLIALFFETNNPFKAALVLADGSVQVAGQVIGNISTMAMNPLLQHWAMILSRSRSRSPPCSSMTVRADGWSSSTASPSSPGCRWGSVSAWAPSGRTSCSDGAATGRGTRWRTPRSCRG